MSKTKIIITVIAVQVAASICLFTLLGASFGFDHELWAWLAGMIFAVFFHNFVSEPVLRRVLEFFF